MDIIWKSSEVASILHAATNLHLGHSFQDGQLFQAIKLPTANLVSELKYAGLCTGEQMDPALITMSTIASSGVNDARYITQQTIARLTGLTYFNEDDAGRISRAISEVRSSFCAHYKKHSQGNLLDELNRAGQQLREQWEPHGPGLLHSIASATEIEVLPAGAQIVMIYPAVGRHAASHAEIKCVTTEPITPNLASPLDTLRLTWLLAILNTNLPRYTEVINFARVNQIISLAMVLPVLSAANEMRLVRFNQATLEQALQSWRLVQLPCLSTDLPTTVDIMWTWWKTYTDGNSSWRGAIAALDRMIA